ncbi:MAG: hypothetical protein ACI8WB_002877 [Phenylobacterium sp.]|jgi:hypothetical protein
MRQPVDLIAVGWCRAQRNPSIDRKAAKIRRISLNSMGFALDSTHPTVKRDFFNSLAHHQCGII